MSNQSDGLPDIKKNNNASGVAGDGAGDFRDPEPPLDYRLDSETAVGLQKLAYLLERMNLSEYLSMMQNRKRIIFSNLIAGISRGFGFTIGMTFLVSLLLFLLARIADLPLLGKYVAKIMEIAQYAVDAKKR